MRTVILVSALITGVYLAQNYKLPDVKTCVMKGVRSVTD